MLKYLLSCDKTRKRFKFDFCRVTIRKYDSKLAFVVCKQKNISVTEIYIFLRILKKKLVREDT